MKREGKIYTVSMSGPEIISTLDSLHFHSLFSSDYIKNIGSAATGYPLYLTKVNVTVDSNPSQDDFQFKKKFFTYLKSKAPQSLLIDTSEIKKISVVKEIRVIVKDAQKADCFANIYFDNKTNTPGEVKLGEPFSPESDFIHIFFEIPPNTDYFSFYLSLANHDVRIKDWECDPQVGHDPPKIKE